jgi:hypothetical protein
MLISLLLIVTERRKERTNAYFAKQKRLTLDSHRAKTQAKAQDNAMTNAMANKGFNA